MSTETCRAGEEAGHGVNDADSVAARVQPSVSRRLPADAAQAARARAALEDLTR